MKVKTISRIEKNYTQELATDKLKVHRNLDPNLHPFERAREYTRALNAVKLDRVFAKPFVSALDGHCDGVSCLATSPTSLVAFLSGACDGEIRLWDLPQQKCVWSAYGHAGFVRGLTVAPDGETFFSCSDDKTIKQWSLQVRKYEGDEQPEPLNTFYGKEAFTGIDHHWSSPTFATCASTVSVWDHHRSDPIQTFSWGADSVISVKYNPAEASLLASTGTDRSICLYDTRVAQSMRKMVMAMRSNALAWNPMEPFNFVVANEDNNCYTFDMRKLDKALSVHKDHVSAVTDIAFSPTGEEFVTGSYDQTIRIFSTRSHKSREVYHTKRMQRIFSVKFSADSRFVLSGSDDTNIRIWKAQASKNLGTLNPREKRKLEYTESLKNRYKHLKEVKRIARHRHVPKFIKKQTMLQRESRERESKKDANRRKHAKAGTIEEVPEKQKSIVRELE